MKKFLIWEGIYYVPKYLTQEQLHVIIKLDYERPILNSSGQMLTGLDLDWEE